MAGISSITNVWNNIKEIDLRPIREEAMNMVKIAVVGGPGTGRSALAAQLRRDPLHGNVELQTPVMVLDIDSAQQAADADLIFLLIGPGDYSREMALARGWNNAGKRVLAVYNLEASQTGERPWVDLGAQRVVYGSVEDTKFLVEELVPAVMELIPDRLLALGRYFPLFRVPIARHLINDTSFSNATYALSTGLAEVVPVLDIPLNVTDMVVLTKTQAFLVYKLGLALGLSTRWQDYVTEFGSVLGGGFLWRQIARSLIGLIPAWGIIPKVGVAYAGTFVVGNTILQWYLTGRHVSAKQMQALYRQAFTVGKDVAKGLLSRARRPRLGKPRLPKPKFGRRKPAELPAPQPEAQTCPNCGRTSAADAAFCQYCGHPLKQTQVEGTPGQAGDAGTPGAELTMGTGE